MAISTKVEMRNEPTSNGQKAYITVYTYHVPWEWERTVAENVLRLRWRAASHIDFPKGNASASYRADEV